MVLLPTGTGCGVNIFDSCCSIGCSPIGGSAFSSLLASGFGSLHEGKISPKLYYAIAEFLSCSHTSTLSTQHLPTVFSRM